MTALQFILALVSVVLGAGGFRIAQVIAWSLKERRQLQMRERRETAELSESVEEAVERARIATLDAARLTAAAKDEELRKVKADRDELGSLLGNEREARRKAARERNAAKDEHADCMRRLDAMQIQLLDLHGRVAVLEQCRLTCSHTSNCPVLTLK